MGVLIERIKKAVDSAEMAEFRDCGMGGLSKLTLADLLKPYDELFDIPSLPEGFVHAKVRKAPAFDPQVKRSKLPLPVRIPELPAPAAQGGRDALTAISAMIAFCLERGSNLPLDTPILDADVGSFAAELAGQICGDSMILDWWSESIACEADNILDLGLTPIPLPYYCFGDDGHDESKINFLYGPHAIAEEIELLIEEESLSDEILSVIDMVGGLAALIELYANSPLPKWVDLKTLWDERPLDRLMERYPGFCRPYLCTDCPPEMPVTSVEVLHFCRDYFLFFAEMDAQNPGGWRFRENEENEAGLFVAHMVEVVQATLMPRVLDCTSQKTTEISYAIAA